MADSTTATGDAATTPVDIGSITDQVLQKLTGYISGDTVEHAISNAIVTAIDIVIKRTPLVLESVGKVGGQVIVGAEDVLLPLVAGLIAPIVGGMFGTDVSSDTFGSRDAGSGREDAARAIVDAFVAAIEGDASGPIEPDDEPAKRIAAAGVHAAIEGWFNAFLAENLADVIPVDWLRFRDMAQLPDEVIGALGIGRLVRRALSPLVNATAATPMLWASNVKYRPTKLPPTTAIREYLRGRYDDTTLRDSLARDGYRDEDIDALINEAQKYLSESDLAWMVWQGIIGQDEAVQTLTAIGYDDQTASKLIILDGLKRADTIHRSVADAATAAYVDGHIDDGDLTSLLNATIPSDVERGLLVDAARAKRALRAVPLSPAEAEACILAGVLPFPEYRAALERDGRTPDAVDALELLLRSKVDKQTTLAQAKADQEKQKADAAATKAKATAAKQQQVADAAKLKQQGDIATLRDAVVRGLIPIARLEQVLTPQFDTDTVAIYVADVEAKRAAYVAQQQKAADAAKRADNTGLSTSQLETAIVDGILTPSQVRSMLTAKGVSGADADVLIAEMQQKASDHAAAVKLHADAQQRAATKRLSLAQAEALTLAGHWDQTRYNAFLSALGYGDADVASLDELLNDKIATNDAAQKIRGQTSAANPAKGLTLEQERQAVILGQKSITDFQSWLVANNFTADAVATLVAELQTAVDTANAARARRATAAQPSDGRLVPLADLTRAAQLGIVSPADYGAQLAARGYSADDVTLELDLLASEIAAKKTPAPVPGSAEALIAASGGTATATATARHVTIDGELAARGLSLSETEAAVKNGLMTLDAYQAWLAANGYGPADAELLRALLAIKLSPAGA